MLCPQRLRTARCSFPRAWSQPGVPLRTLATRPCATTDTHRHDERHSDAKHNTYDVRPDTFTAEGWSHPIHASARTEAKKSLFVAHASRLPSASPVLLRAFLEHITAQPALKRATHCMYAWRVVSPAGSGLGSGSNANTSTNAKTTTNTVLSGHNDGGEKGAGERLAHLLEATGSANVIVVVSRWYGGVHLGSERWRMISGVAKDALARGAFGASNNGPDSGSFTSTGEAVNNMKVSSNKKKRKK